MTSPPERNDWRIVVDRFHAALELDPTERQQYLERLDPALRAEVASLLDADAGPGPIAALPATSTPAGSRIGPYRLGPMLGVGGMGVVYQAEREGPDFSQRVALKLIRAGFGDPRMEERLRRERRILARLEHPGIARFIDGGTTETGQSYFAMEYIEGTTLLEYCNERQLSVADRLRLFLEVCAVLDYAHQQLVVHGDLKPGNVLVGTDGRPRLLDFGIAELLGHDDDDDSGPVTTPWLTPDYASPERLRGTRLTTGADVYALGVMLYELLSGQRPFRLTGLSPAEIEHRVTETAPTRPSSVAQSPRLARELAGDLDTIILTAIAADPARRYPSAARLADDLRRYLDGKPVLARPVSAAYRAGKFVRRHRTAVVAVVLIFLSLLGGMTAVSWQAAVARRERDEAERAEQEAEEVSTFLVGLFEATDPRKTSGDTIATRALLREGLARVDELTAQPALQARMLDALGRVHIGLSRMGDARELMTRALEVRRSRLGPDHPDMALSYASLGELNWRLANLTVADTLVAKAIAIQRASPGPALVRTLNIAASLDVAMARLGEAERHAREAVAIGTRSLDPDHPLAAESTRILASVLRREGKLDQSAATYRTYWAMNARHFGPRSPEAAGASIHLADLYWEMMGRTEEAERLYREALAALKAAPVGDDHISMVHGRGSLSNLLASRGDWAEADSLRRVTVTALRRALGPDHPSVGIALNRLSQGLAEQGRLDEAAELAGESLDIVRRNRGPNQEVVSGPLLALGRIRQLQGRTLEARQLTEEAVAIREANLGRAHPQTARAIEELSRLWLAAGHAARAESLATEAAKIFHDHFDPGQPDVTRVDSLLADIHSRQGVSPS